VRVSDESGNPEVDVSETPSDSAKEVSLLTRNRKIQEKSQVMKKKEI
jgi:hypothetical protein